MTESLAQGHRDNRLLAALPSGTLAQMGSHLRQISIAQGAVMYEPGDAVDDVYFPQSGMISLLVVTKGGNSVETSTVGREGAIGLQCAFGPRRSFTRATTQIGGRFLAIRAKRFEQIALDDAPLRTLIGRYTEILWAEAQQIAACNTAHDAASRLARWLLQCADRIGSDKLALTQELLAQMLNVRRTTVTLLAQALQHKGLIKYSRGQITIVDRDGLEREACECFHVLHHDKLPHTIGVKL